MTLQLLWVGLHKTHGIFRLERTLNRELRVECRGSSEAEGSPTTQTAGYEQKSLPGTWDPRSFPPKLSLCLINCLSLSKTRMAGSSNAQHSVFVSQPNAAGTVTGTAIYCSTSKALPCPGTGSWELLITGGLFCASCTLLLPGFPLEVWDVPVPPGQSEICEFRDCAGWGNRRFPDWDVSPGMESSKEHSSVTASATPPPTSCSWSTSPCLGSDGKCLIRKQFFFLNSFLFNAHTFI